MLTFFRHIRKRFLSENKFSKYLIYAIGEIALVMIGILLALQVNNWNETRKERIEEKNLLVNFIENLNSDNEAMQEALKQIKQIDTLHTNLYLIGIEKQEIEDIGNPINIRRLPYTGILTINNFPNISGRLSNETIRNAIAQYYNELNIYNTIAEELREIVENKIRPLLGNENIYDLKAWYANQDRRTTQSSFISKQKLIDFSSQPLFQQLLIQASIKLRSMKLIIEGLIQTNKSLNATIQTELTNY